MGPITISYGTLAGRPRERKNMISKKKFINLVDVFSFSRGHCNGRLFTVITNWRGRNKKARKARRFNRV